MARRITVPTTIRIPALPCATHTDYGRCGKPAMVAWITPTGSGEWMLMPICKDCALAMAKNYGVLPETQNEEQ